MENWRGEEAVKQCTIARHRCCSFNAIGERPSARARPNSKSSTCNGSATRRTCYGSESDKTRSTSSALNVKLRCFRRPNERWFKWRASRALGVTRLTRWATPQFRLCSHFADTSKNVRKHHFICALCRYSSIYRDNINTISALLLIYIIKYSKCMFNIIMIWHSRYYVPLFRLNALYVPNKKHLTLTRYRVSNWGIFPKYQSERFKRIADFHLRVSFKYFRNAILLHFVTSLHLFVVRNMICTQFSRIVHNIWFTFYTPPFNFVTNFHGVTVLPHPPPPHDNFEIEIELHPVRLGW
jgi:hypothetical protein